MRQVLGAARPREPVAERRTLPTLGPGTVLVATLLVLPLALAAGEDAPVDPAPLTGELRLERDLRVEAGETLRIGPNTTLSGPGRLLVYGDLLAIGSAEAPIRFHVPVYVFETGRTEISDARFEGIRGFSLLVTRDAVSLRDVTFDGKGIGDVGVKVLPSGPVDLSVTDATFRDFTRIGLDVVGPATVRVTRATFEDNAEGLFATVQGSAPLRLDVTGSTFTRSDAAHATFEIVGEGTEASEIRLTANVFSNLLADPAADPSARAAVGLHERGRVGEDGVRRINVLSAGNSYVDNPTGLYAYASRDKSSFQLTSFADLFERNGVGVYAVLASLTLDGTVFRNNHEWDIYVPYAPQDGAPRVLITNSTTYNLARIGVAPGAGSVETPTGIVTGAAIALGAVGVVSLAAVLISSALRDALVHAAFAPLYARLRPNEILAHEKRRGIVDYVAANPGTHMRRIGQALDISYGALTYHIYRLEKEGYLVSREEGLFKRFFPAAGAGGARTKTPTGPMPTALRRLEREILNTIIAMPGQAQSAIAQHLGLSRQALHYHIKKLEGAGFISKVPQGRETLLYAREEAAKAVAEARDAEAAFTRNLSEAEVSPEGATAASLESAPGRPERAT